MMSLTVPGGDFKILLYIFIIFILVLFLRLLLVPQKFTEYHRIFHTKSSQSQKESSQTLRILTHMKKNLARMCESFFFSLKKISQITAFDHRDSFDFYGGVLAVLSVKCERVI